MEMDGWRWMDELVHGISFEVLNNDDRTSSMSKSHT